MTITDADQRRGLYGKYRVERVDGKDKGPYFVLAPNTDPFAVAAIEAYAMECEDTHPNLAKDLLAWRDSAQTLHPELAYAPYQPEPLTVEEQRFDDARAFGPQLADRLDAIYQAYQEYEAALERREHGAVAATRFIRAVAEQVGRGAS